MISKNYSPTKRKAISSIIGSFFFIVIMVAAFGAILTAMSLQAQLVEQQTSLSKQYVKQFQENYEIEAFCGAANLGIYVKNIGANEVQVATIWYYEQAGPDWKATPVDISFAKSFVPPGAKVDVLADPSTVVPLASIPGMYTIKVVSTLGNILETEFNGSCPSGPLDPLQDQLVAKPAVYAAFPNPWNIDDDSTTGYFAILVVNPTSNPMQVYRTSFTLLTNTNPASFKDGSTAGFPGAPPIGTWYDDKDTVFWEDFTGIEILPYSIAEFIAIPESANSVDDSTINTINTNTLTSFGQFGAIKIDTIGTYGTKYAVPNIFMVDSPTGTAPTYMINAPPVANPQTMYVALHNSADNEKIDKDSKLVINIPAAFTVLDDDLDISGNALPGGGGFDSPPARISFDDNSEQMTYNLTADMAAGGYARIGISIEPPQLTSNAVYIFHTYATGTSTDSKPTPTTVLIGPVAELALKVCKPSGC